MEQNYNLSKLPRNIKIVIAVLTDLALCISCTWFAFYLRLDKFIVLKDAPLIAAIISLTIAIPLFWSIGLYRTILRYSDLSIIFSILVSFSIYSLLYFLIIGIYGISGVPRSIGIIQPLLLFFVVTGSRLFVKYLIGNTLNLNEKSKYKKRVLIYGAGSAGRQLASSLENNSEFKIEGFLDDDSKLYSQVMQGYTIYSPFNLTSLINSKKINLILIALPSATRLRRNEIISKLNKHKLDVKTLPSIQDIVDGKVSVSDIKDLNIDDLLNRDKISPNYNLLKKNIENSVVLVTGAGGSIGSELCRQIVKLNPKKLVLLELNEYSLYKIFEELTAIKNSLNVIPLICNVQDEEKLNKIFENFEVETIYHAAAYKHVPLVEVNICEGVKNNVFGTLSVARSALKQKVSNLVLISSDKAVRPTNIMGATKRLAELCMQGIYENNTSRKTKFSIVRFGNVLESSGSVIPKFKKQIKEGGPVTLTHLDVTRYFMTITEAAQLVIQAGAMSIECEVFFLDMGESVRIKDLIYKMINLSGLKIKDEKNLNGDIEITTIGLRPGEKLYEELLIGDNPQKTIHKKIQKAQDPHISFSKLEPKLNNLKNLSDTNDVYNVKELLKNLVKTYVSNTPIVDHFYFEKNKDNKNTKSENIRINNVVKIK